MNGNQFEFVDLRSSIVQETFSEHVQRGLSAEQKWLSPRFFYDERGSELFKEITQLPEYYPFDSELNILRTYPEEIVSCISQQGAIVELGSGSSVKTRILLEEALKHRKGLHYVPVDISADFLRDNSRALLDDYEALQVTAVAGTYETALERLPEVEGPRLFLFLGGNLGNYEYDDAKQLLSQFSDEMTSEDRLVVGIDLLKDVNVIERAYNDDRGVTEAFNKNILTRINRELDGNFRPIHFRHSAPFVKEKSRIEMHLVSKREQSVRIEAVDETFHFDQGESIHTECSHKFNRELFRELLDGTGLDVEEIFSDKRNYFAEMILS